MKTYYRILLYARPVGIYLPQYVLLTLIYVVFSVVNFTMLIPLLNVIFGEVVIEQTTRPEFSLSIRFFKDLFNYHLGYQINTFGTEAALQFVVVALLISNLLSNTTRYLAAIILARIRVNLITQLRNHFYEALTRLDLGYFTTNRRGDLMSRGTVDIQQIENSVVNTLKVLLKEPLLITGLFIALFHISATLTGFTLLIIPISGVVISYLARRLKKRATKLQQTIGQINGVLDESLGGMRVIKAFNSLTFMRRKFAGIIDAYGKHLFRYATRQNLAQPISEFLGVGALTVILYIGGSMVLNKSWALPPAEFIGFLAIFSQILPPSKALASSFSNVMRGISAGERVFEIIDSEVGIQSPEQPVRITQLEKGITFQNVSFAYEKDLVLKDINFVVKKGEVVALVGPSGGGKSTIADLIPRFYDPTNGQIDVDDIDLRSYQIEDLRDMVGIVTQDSILFNDTVRNNITFGQVSTDDEIIRAAEIANAHAFIEKLPEAYDTVVGEGGAKLSGGQRQRVSIARALLKNPPILILDEATSALDSQSERLVQEAIYQVMANRTTLVIAHRLSTIQRADKILVIQHGEIIERGSHSDLVAQKGLYRKLIDMQSF